MVKTKEFHLGDVLTLATGFNVSSSEKGVSELAGFLTGNYNWSNYRTVATANQCQQRLIRQFPQFNSPEMECALIDLSARLREANELKLAWVVAMRWLQEQIPKYGEYITVESMVEQK